MLDYYTAVVVSVTVTASPPAARVTSGIFTLWGRDGMGSQRERERARGKPPTHTEKERRNPLPDGRRRLSTDRGNSWISARTATT